MQSLPPLPVLISDRARSSPNGIAIESISTNERLTWHDLDRDCRRWADAYRRLAVESGEYVVTMMPNTPSAIYAWLGCAWARAIEVPINTDYRGEWLTHAINNSRARLIVTSRQFAPALALVADNLEHVHIVAIYDLESGDDESGLAQHFRVLNAEEFFANAEPNYDLALPQPWDVMSVIYTSGTTGQAKAVIQPWGMQELSRLLFSPPEFKNCTFYGFWPPFHTLGKSMIFVPAAFDGKLVLRDRFSITDFWADVRTYDCTGAYVVSVIASFLQSQPERDDDADNPLKAVLMGPIIPEVDEFKRRFDVNVYTAFGSTEVGSALYSMARDVNGSNFQSCGRVLPEAPIEIAVVDSHDFPVGPGVPGELIVRPTVPWTLNLGYLNMPEATVRAWRNGWYHTGDSFVYDADGEYYFVDRSKDYIRRRGENISSFEVEQAVCSFPAVVQAAAVAVPSEVGEDEVMVFVVCAPGAKFSPPELIEFLVDRMPKFALPRYIEHVEQLPTTQATFRVQKNKLRERGPGPDTFDRAAMQPV
jgi:crotonobetaine/carnitine-CoA ligase